MENFTVTKQGSNIVVDADDQISKEQMELMGQIHRALHEDAKDVDELYKLSMKGLSGSPSDLGSTQNQVRERSTFRGHFQPLRIILGPAKDNCPCCGKPLQEKDK
jgi:hypothetical protein